MTITFVLLVISFVLALLAAFGVPSRVNLFALAFAVFVLAQLVTGWRG